jgi:hypothetical protein
MCDAGSWDRSGDRAVLEVHDHDRFAHPGRHDDQRIARKKRGAMRATELTEIDRSRDDGSRRHVGITVSEFPAHRAHRVSFTTAQRPS